ncbi:hypothetical protein C7S20_05505 [Christiangramia fulva]|uniref:Uncharacterized protein n=2 Tax=Christiangramia fulva TaxID=2126553 RepID=A0A2R3Z3C3_9FLAO|nr:hypothetical protein C7S20_05505 [Christiangramia fulva]
MLAGGYPNFRFPSGLIEEVDLQDFCNKEEERLALSVETQFETYPSNIPMESLEGHEIAVLSKSQLSGCQFVLRFIRITNGKRVKTFEIKSDEHFLKQGNPKVYNITENEDIKPQDKIPKFYLYEIWNYLEQLDILYRGESLAKVYHEVTSHAYSSFLIECYKERSLDWISFLGISQSEKILELYRLLDISRRSLGLELDRLPISLERELKMFRDIRNPLKKRIKRNYENPEDEDIRLLSDIGLCIYYNNHININSLESEIIQREVLEEFKNRGYYIRNEHLLMNHANPIEINWIPGIPSVNTIRKVVYRTAKDIAPFETGLVNSQLQYEGYYGIFESLTDIELVSKLNKQVGIKYWGMGRASIIRALRKQLEKRGIDTSSISGEKTFSLKYCVVLDNKKLVRLGEIPENRLMLILKAYLRKCYPDCKLGELRIINYDLDKLQFTVSVHNTLYEIPINDLLKKKREMKAL